MGEHAQQGLLKGPILWPFSLHGWNPTHYLCTLAPVTSGLLTSALAATPLPVSCLPSSSSSTEHMPLKHPTQLPAVGICPLDSPGHCLVLAYPVARPPSPSTLQQLFPGLTVHRAFS